MTNRRPVLAATFTLALVGGGLVAAGAAQAHRASPSRPTTVATPKPRTKNAALPTTTKPKTVTSPAPTIKPRVKNGKPKGTSSAGTTCGNAGCPTNPKKG